MRNSIRLLPLPLLGALAIGCGQGDAPRPQVGEQPTIHVDGTKYIAAVEPAGARDVIEARKDATDGEAIVVVGKVGGMKKPVVEGRAAFTIVDLSLKPRVADPDCFDFI